MNEMHYEKYWDEEMQHYQDEENRSMNRIENQLVEFVSNTRRNLPN